MSTNKSAIFSAYISAVHATNKTTDISAHWSAQSPAHTPANLSANFPTHRSTNLKPTYQQADWLPFKVPNHELSH